MYWLPLQQKVKFPGNSLTVFSKFPLIFSNNFFKIFLKLTKIIFSNCLQNSLRWRNDRVILSHISWNYLSKCSKLFQAFNKNNSYVSLQFLRNNICKITLIFQNYLRQYFSSICGAIWETIHKIGKCDFEKNAI